MLNYGKPSLLLFKPFAVSIPIQKIPVKIEENDIEDDDDEIEELRGILTKLDSFDCKKPLSAYAQFTNSDSIPTPTKHILINAKDEVKYTSVLNAPSSNSLHKIRDLSLESSHEVFVKSLPSLLASFNSEIMNLTSFSMTAITEIVKLFNSLSEEYENQNEIVYLNGNIKRNLIHLLHICLRFDETELLSDEFPKANKEYKILSESSWYKAMLKNGYVPYVTVCEYIYSVYIHLKKNLFIKNYEEYLNYRFIEDITKKNLIQHELSKFTKKVNKLNKNGYNNCYIECIIDLEEKINTSIHLNPIVIMPPILYSNPHVDDILIIENKQENEIMEDIKQRILLRHERKAERMNKVFIIEKKKSRREIKKEKQKEIRMAKKKMIKKEKEIKKENKEIIKKKENKKIIKKKENKEIIKVDTRRKEIIRIPDSEPFISSTVSLLDAMPILSLPSNSRIAPTSPTNSPSLLSSSSSSSSIPISEPISFETYLERFPTPPIIGLPTSPVFITRENETVSNDVSLLISSNEVVLNDASLSVSSNEVVLNDVSSSLRSRSRSPSTASCSSCSSRSSSSTSCSSSSSTSSSSTSPSPAPSSSTSSVNVSIPVPVEKKGLNPYAPMFMTSSSTSSVNVSIPVPVEKKGLNPYAPMFTTLALKRMIVNMSQIAYTDPRLNFVPMSKRK
jgi:hypothetical protein